MIRADSGADSVVIRNTKSSVTKARTFSKNLILIYNINSGQRDFRCVIMRIVVFLCIEQEDREKTGNIRVNNNLARIIGEYLWEKRQKR